MRLKTVWMDLISLILLIPVVIALFRFVPDRQVAATVAGVLFVGVPAGLMVRRLRRPLLGPWANGLWWGGVVGFWLLFAWPILTTRLSGWGIPFEDLVIFGGPAPVWHAYANRAYMVMMGAILLAGWLDRRAQGDKKA